MEVEMAFINSGAIKGSFDPNSRNGENCPKVALFEIFDDLYSQGRNLLIWSRGSADIQHRPSKF